MSAAAPTRGTEPLRVLADVTTWTAGRSGVGLYTERLLQALAAGYPLDQWLLAANLATPEVDIAGERLTSRLPVRALWQQTAMAAHGLLPRRWPDGRRARPDLAFYPNYLAPLLAGSPLPSAPLVVTFHDMAVYLQPETFSFRKRELQRRLLPLVADRAAAILTPSINTRRDVLRLLDVEPRRVVVTPLAADPRFFEPVDDAASAAFRQQHGIGGRYLLAVGTLEPRKNLVRLVTAFERIAATRRDLQLVLVGGKGSRDQAIVDALGRSPASSAIITPGYVSAGALHGLYAGALALCYPSLYEGFGLPVVEAMAAGAPVLVSRGSSLDEVAGDAALAVDPRDHADIADAMARLCDDDGLRQRLRAAGLARAAMFSWARTAELTRDVFLRVRAGVAPDGSEDCPPRR